MVYYKHFYLIAIVTKNPFLRVSCFLKLIELDGDRQNNSVVGLGESETLICFMTENGFLFPSSEVYSISSLSYAKLIL